MARKSWFNLLKTIFGSSKKPKPEKRAKKWSFLFERLKSKKKLPPIAASYPSTEKSLSEAEEEQNKHALAVAIATTAAAEAALAAAHAAADVVRRTRTPSSPQWGDKKICEVAALKIQTAFRGYLARKALRALKGLVKLQAMVRGRAVRRQARTTLKSLQSLIKIQKQVQRMRNRTAENDRTHRGNEHINKRIKDLVDIKMKLEANDQKRWERSLLSNEEVDAVFLNRREEALKRERAMGYLSSHQQERRNARRSSTSRISEFESDNRHPRWSWLEQWVGDQPWQREELDRGSLPKLHRRTPEHILAGPIDFDLDSTYFDKGEETPVRQRSPSRQSPTLFRRNSFHLPTRSSIRNDEPSSSTEIPSYMATTESAKAKARSISTPKHSLGGAFDISSDHNSPSKNRLSPFPSFHSEVGTKIISKPDVSHQRSLHLKGLLSQVRSRRSSKDLSIDSEFSLQNWDRRTAV